MRRLAAVVALLVVAGIVFFALRGNTTRPGEAARKPAVDSADIGSEPESSLRESASRESAELPRESPVAPARTISVIGSIVGDDERPIEGASVSMLGASASTNVDGRFDLEAPALPAERETWLEIAAAKRELVRKRVRGSDTAERDGRKIIDVGRIVLRSGGEVGGVLVDANGQALRGARLSIDGQHDARVDPDGRFRFEHVGPGKHELSCAAIDPRAPLREFDLEPGSAIDLGTLTAHCGGFVSGRIETQDGRPIFSAYVQDRSRGPFVRFRPSAMSEVDGSFWLALRGSSASLKVDRPGYVTHDDGALGTLRVTGTIDVRIVLERVPAARFLVVDGATGSPVETFALRLQPGAFVDRSQRVETHAGGTIELARSEDHERFAVEAPGYAPQVGELAPPSEERQVIRLSRAGSITGRLVAAKLFGARVTIERAQLEDESFDLAPAAAPMRTVMCKEGGSFQIDDLAAGTYGFEARTSDGSQAAIERVFVPGATNVNLGEIRLVLGASLKGRLLLPAGASNAKVHLTAKVGERRRSDPVDADGRFSFRGLPSGRWELSIAAEPQVVVSGPVTALDLAPGEAREIELDLRDRAASSVSFVVRANGEPTPARIFVASPATNGAMFETDGDGKLSKWIGIAGPATVRALTSRGLPLVEREAQFGTGEVRIELDAEVGQLAVSISPPADPWINALVAVRVQGSSFSGKTSIAPSDEAERIDLGPIGVGRYDLDLTFVGKTGGGTRVFASSATTVEIRRGETTLAEFPEPHAR